MWTIFRSTTSSLTKAVRMRLCSLWDTKVKQCEFSKKMVKLENGTSCTLWSFSGTQFGKNLFKNFHCSVLLTTEITGRIYFSQKSKIVCVTERYIQTVVETYLCLPLYYAFFVKNTIRNNVGTQHWEKLKKTDPTPSKTFWGKKIEPDNLEALWWLVLAEI